MVVFGGLWFLFRRLSDPKDDSDLSSEFQPPAYDPLTDEPLIDSVDLTIRNPRGKIRMQVNRSNAAVYVQFGPRAFPQLRKLGEFNSGHHYYVYGDDGPSLFELYIMYEVFFGDAGYDEGFRDLESGWNDHHTVDYANEDYGPVPEGYYPEEPEPEPGSEAEEFTLVDEKIAAAPEEPSFSNEDDRYDSGDSGYSDFGDGDSGEFGD